jgi:hypothetical protein
LRPRREFEEWNSTKTRHAENTKGDSNEGQRRQDKTSKVEPTKQRLPKRIECNEHEKEEGRDEEESGRDGYCRGRKGSKAIEPVPVWSLGMTVWCMCSCVAGGQNSSGLD